MLLKIKILILTMAFSLSYGQEKVEKLYSKNYFDNKKIESQGWVSQDEKIDYWFFYYENGNKKEEGHYDRNKKTNWWIFYDLNGNVLKKCEFKNDILNGICIIYKNDKIVSAEKYKFGKKIKQWGSLTEYKKDNPTSFL
jgi:antitoxin component YwqK of YwqJK toxin-antitoxin module